MADAGINMQFGRHVCTRQREVELRETPVRYPAGRCLRMPGRRVEFRQ
jgi:hypothetical protein